MANSAEGENFSSASNASILARKSWLAYVGPTIGYAVTLYVLISFVWSINSTAALVLVILTMAIYIYVLFKLYSYMLYINEAGVWVFSGVFPWNKGASGVKWRDLDEAIFYQNFFSWIFRAYSLRVSNRYKPGAEISLTTMHNGSIAVQRINIVHQDLLAKSESAFADDMTIARQN